MSEEILGKDNRIGRRMIWLIVLFSSIVTLLITVTQLFFDYHQQRGALDQVLNTIEVHVPTITGSVWALDKVQTELALDALVRMPNIERVSVLVSKPERRWMAGVNKPSGRTLTRTYPLVHSGRDREQNIGALEVIASLDTIYMSVAKHAIVIFLSNALKTFFVVIFMYFAFRRVVTDRLERLASKVTSLAHKEIPGAIQIGPAPYGRDELDTLDQAFDQMNTHLMGTLEQLEHTNVNLRFENAERRRAEDELKNHKRQLEQQVRERAAQIVMQKERLQQTLTELQLIIENASLGFAKVEVMPDGACLIRHTNRALGAILGYPQDALEGKDIRDLYLKGKADTLAVAYSEVLPAGRTYRGEHRLARSNGEVINVWMVGTAIDPLDLSKGTIWLFDDITARKRVEKVLAESKEAAEIALWQRESALGELKRAHAVLSDTQSELVEREKMAALGALVAGVTHELKTPIGNALLSASALAQKHAEMSLEFKEGMKRSSLSAFLEAVGEGNDIVVRNMQRAAELVESFRNVAVDQSTSMRRRFRLDEVVAETILVLHPTIRKTPFVIDCNIPKGIEMDSYPGPLGQVLSNLVSNALIHAFVDCDYGTVNIEARMLTAEQVEIEVRDNGLGIAKDNIEHIFEAFFSTRFGQGGSGLGLSIVSNFVTGILGGKIVVSSEEGKGTTFIITLPLIASEIGLSDIHRAGQLGD